MTSSILLLFCVLVQATTAQIPPHIVFIIADDLGWNDVGWHNPAMLTPNLDKLATAGVILDSVYVQPKCSPSRGAFMTGYYPYHLGIQEGFFRSTRAQFIPLNVTMLPENLKELGYATHIVGKWHLGFCNWSYTPTHRGFDSFFGLYNGHSNHYTRKAGKGYDLRSNEDIHYTKDKEYSAHLFARKAIEIIATSQPQKQPLFLYLPFLSVHSPMQVPKKYEELYSEVKDRKRRVFSGMVSALDEAVGNITDALEKYGFMDNLLLVFTTDNGAHMKLGGSNWPLRSGKGTLWEGGTRGVTFAYSKTLLQKTSYVNTRLIHAVDWFPTFVHIAGGTAAPGMDGLNVWQAISGNEPSPRKEFVYNIDERRGNAAIRVGDYKLVEGEPTSQRSLRKKATKKKRKRRPVYRLFNIKKDPTEDHDISADQKSKLFELIQRLEFFKRSLVPIHFPDATPGAHPRHFNGTWSPGWC